MKNAHELIMSNRWRQWQHDFHPQYISPSYDHIFYYNFQYNPLTNNQFNAVIAAQVLLNDLQKRRSINIFTLLYKYLKRKSTVNLVYTLAPLFPRKPAYAVIILICCIAHL